MVPATPDVARGWWQGAACRGIIHSNTKTRINPIQIITISTNFSYSDTIGIGSAGPYKKHYTRIEVTDMAKGMLLVGHGSTMPYNQELVEKTAEFIKAKNAGYIVKCGFMNMNKPTIKESLEAFRHEPIEALVVVPLFLAKGVHIEKDIPGEIGLAEGVKKGSFVLNGRSVPLLYADPIGSDPLLAELMVKNANKALSLL
jgi:sirohydrochlorin cobalto/nickelchelatase